MPKDEKIVQYAKIAIMIFAALYLFVKIEQIIGVLEECVVS